MERAGIDIISDGEMRRESYSNRFATALDGIDIDNPAPPSTAPATRTRYRASSARSAASSRSRCGTSSSCGRTRPADQVTLPGPFTMTQQAQNDYYGDRGARDGLAGAVNAEIRDLSPPAPTSSSSTSPTCRRAPRRRALRRQGHQPRAGGDRGQTALHTCFGYAHIVHEAPAATRSWPSSTTPRRQDLDRGGAAELDSACLRELAGKDDHARRHRPGRPGGRDAEAVAARIRAALDHVPPERLIVAPDCGMKYLPRATAFGKLRAMVDGAAIVRAELT